MAFISLNITILFLSVSIYYSRISAGGVLFFNMIIAIKLIKLIIALKPKEMIKILHVLFFVVLCNNLMLAQSIECPPPMIKKCYEDFMTTPTIIDGEGYDLDTKLIYNTESCDSTNLSITHTLIDSNGMAKVQCTSTVLILNLTDDEITFPENIKVSGYTLDEVYNKDIFNDGLVDTDCGSIRYTYEDVVVGAFPLLSIFRNWTALNWCSSKTKLAIQRIDLLDVPNSGIRTQVYDCAGQSIKVDSFDILFHGQKLDWLACSRSYDSLHVIMNCLAEENLQTESDVLELRLHDIYNPLVGVSSLDLVVIHQHILGIRSMEDTCQLEAADVNRDGRINGIDLVELRKMILGIYSDWPFGNTPTMTVNGESRATLTFGLTDFPLTNLDIVLANQGNVTTNY